MAYDSKICTCNPEKGKPLDYSTCDMHAAMAMQKGNKAPCGMKGCECGNYIPHTNRSPSLKWPKCTCGHSAQEHG